MQDGVAFASNFAAQLGFEVVQRDRLAANPWSVQAHLEGELFEHASQVDEPDTPIGRGVRNLASHAR